MLFDPDMMLPCSQAVSVSYLLVPETPTTATIVELRH